MRLGFVLEQRLSLECRTCRDSAGGELTEIPREIASAGAVSLMGCVVVGACPSCRRGGMSDDAIRLMLRRLNRPSAAMRFPREEIARARRTLRYVERIAPAKDSP